MPQSASITQSATPQKVAAAPIRAVNDESRPDNPFWKHPDFWIHTILGAGGLLFALLAFIEARQAKRAATAAGRTVKMQTVAIELTEISQRLDRLDPDVEFSQARDLINEVSRKIRRLVSPFSTDPDLCASVTSLRDSLKSANDSLNDVLPNPGASEQPAPRATYYAVQSALVSVNGSVADLLGLLESKSTHISEPTSRPWFGRKSVPISAEDEPNTTTGQQ